MQIKRLLKGRSSTKILDSTLRNELEMIAIDRDVLILCILSSKE